MQSTQAHDAPNFTQKKLYLAVTLAISTLSSLPVSAQDLETVEVTGQKEAQFKVDTLDNHKIATDLSETPKTINIIDDTLLESQGVTSLNDALRNVSGVSTFGAGEGGGGNITTNDKITIRGFSANQNIYIDGIRDVAGSSRDTYNIEQIEVSKGADSSLSGKGTSGGTVNLVTKKAKFDDFTSISGSLDDTDNKRISLDYNKSVSDTLAFRVNALVNKGGDPLNNGVEDYETLAIAPAITAKLSDNTTLSAFAQFMQQDNTPVMGLPFINETAAKQLDLQEGPIDSRLWDNYYGIKGRDFEEIDSQKITLVLNHDVNETLSIRNQTRVAKNNKKSVIGRPILVSTRSTDADGNRITTYDPNKLVNTAYTQNIDEEVSLAVNQLDAIVKLDYGTVKHHLVTGIELYKEDKHNYQVELPALDPDDQSISLLNPKDIKGSGELKRTGNKAEANAEGMSLYALNTFHFGERIIATAGIRYEDFEVKGSTFGWEKKNGKWSRVFIPGVKSAADFISWNTSLGFKPTDDGFVYIAAANSQDPAAGDLKFTYTKERIDRFSELDPEESKNIEVGTKWELAQQHLLVNAAVFKTNKTVRDRDENGNYFLSGEQEAKGIELSAVGKVTDDLAITTNFTYQKTSVTKAFNSKSVGDGLTAAPSRMFNLWLDYALTEKFGVGFGGEYSSGNTYWRRQKAYYSTGEVTLLNAMASYQFTDSFNIQLNIDNLSDKEYVTDYSARGHFRPGDPRKIKLSVNYKM